MDYDCPEDDRLYLQHCMELLSCTFMSLPCAMLLLHMQIIVMCDLHLCIAQRWMLKYPFYRWLNRGIQKLNNLLEVFCFELARIDKVHSLDWLWIKPVMGQ